MEETKAVNGRAKGIASILAIGTANPFNCVYQVDYLDYYFKITNSEDMTRVKDKFKCICKYIYIYIYMLCDLLA